MWLLWYSQASSTCLPYVLFPPETPVHSGPKYLLGPWLIGNGILVPLIKGGPMLFGFSVPRMLIGASIAATFGLGLAIIYGLLQGTRDGRRMAIRR